MTQSQVSARARQFWDTAFERVGDSDLKRPIGKRAKAIADGLTQRGVESVLDLGCAVGRLAVFLAKRGFRVCGVDYSRVAIAKAARWANEEGIGVQFCVADAAALPFRDGSYGAVVANSVLDHMSLDRAKRAVAQIRRVLADSGVLYASFDGSEADPPGSKFEFLPDGTKSYTAGPQAGMIWRFFTGDDIRLLVSEFASTKIEIDEGGSRLVWAQGPE